jgi:hypothetical protein
MRIINGRTLGDTGGKFTCHRYNGSSVVDYGIVHSSVLQHVQYFSVHNSFEALSDHCMISMGIPCRMSYLAGSRVL